MSFKKERASAKAPATTKNIKLASAYKKLSPEARGKAVEKITEHLKEMPPICRATYKKAIAGKSLRAAVNSFCAQCTMWQREEVRLCTSLECAIWPYRPYQPGDVDDVISCSKNPSDGPDSESESTNSAKVDDLLQGIDQGRKGGEDE